MGPGRTDVTEPFSKSQIWQARIAALLVLGLLALGVAWYGVTEESLGRLWTDLLDRPTGPMMFRFILQPTMAIIAALRDGIRDARLGRRPYLWALIYGVRDSGGRSGRLWEGIVATARILILGVVMDIIYQWKVLDTFYPGQSAVVATLLAFVPYLLLRGPFDRIAYHWVARPASQLSRQIAERTMANPDLKFDTNTELSSRRTGMSFQRTRMSADRTLMSVIRTSLSLIGFGFTIAQVFQKLRDQDIITKAAAPRNFGLALVGLGIVMLVIGIVYHVQFMLGLRHLRGEMREEGLIHGETIFPLSFTLVTAFVLLMIGIAAVMSSVFHVGPFE